MKGDRRSRSENRDRGEGARGNTTEGTSRPAPVVKRNGAKRTRKTSAGCLGGRDREARGKRTSRTCSRRTRGVRRAGRRASGREGRGGRCVCTDGTSGNEMHGKYVSRGIRETPREVGEGVGRRGGKSGKGGKKREREGGRRGREILTLEMRELPRVCGVRNFLAIYRRWRRRRVRETSGRRESQRGCEALTKRIFERESERRRRRTARREKRDERRNRNPTLDGSQHETHGM